MKSPEVYAQLKSELAPWFKAAGFKRAKGLLSWSRPQSDHHVVVWCQVSQDGWESHAGSKFAVEFQRSIEPVVGVVPARRQRLISFMSELEREEIRSIQNGVIASLSPPPKTHPSLHISAQVSQWYMGQFKTVAVPYTDRQDVWFRYSSPEHVSRWAHFILRKLPQCVAAVETWA